MNITIFRHFYDYHFAENRALWDRYIIPLTDDQFTRETPYSKGSIQNQILHIIDADDVWFSTLQGLEPGEPLDPAIYRDRDRIRRHWDTVEARMRQYLDRLEDDDVFDKPFPPGEDENLIVWQVLLHVVNHGTDHRAQLLRLLNDIGVETTSQDYIFYTYEHP